MQRCQSCVRTPEQRRHNSAARHDSPDQGAAPACPPTGECVGPQMTLTPMGPVASSGDISDCCHLGRRALASVSREQGCC